MPNRRAFLLSAGSALAVASFSMPAGARKQAKLRLGGAVPFSFDALTNEAQALAKRRHAPTPTLPDSVLEPIDYRALGFVHYDTDYALFRDGPGQFPVTFFMLGRFFRTPVHMHVLSGRSGKVASREVIYDPSYFDMPVDSPARRLPDGAGFAGFRFQESRLGDQKALDWRKNDWVAFLGASYFRAIGELYQYGLSARGVAINVAMADKIEEFPNFTRFYFEPSANGGDAVTVYGLLEGPSVTGAFRFVMERKKAVLMDVEARLFLRRDVERLGLAPLTSMYWYSETRKPDIPEWRPETHDSDGLAIWTGAGERIWSPLENPPGIDALAFADTRPRGFGLLQRDRSFDHYLDGVHYERRPSLWVEPLNDWGEGAVQLIELSTDTETNDNIVACWVPKSPAKAGNSYQLRYRLHWTDGEPYPSDRAVCVATRQGVGGQPGQSRLRGAVKFVVEFLGGPLKSLPYGVFPEAVLSASSGKFSDVFTEAVPDGVPGHWRAQFDFTPAGKEPADLRLYLKTGSEALSETWLYHLHTETLK